MRPDRVVIGSNEERAIEVMKDLYRPLYLIETPIVITSLEAAELIKYAANAFFATKITFINEIANLCDAIGCDVHDVARGMGMDNRIGRKFLHPGPGLRRFLFSEGHAGSDNRRRPIRGRNPIVDAVIEANECQRDAMIPKIEKLVGDLNGKQIGVLGLSFKPETDDMRESPAIDIINELHSRGATVRAFDPVAMDEANIVCPTSNMPRTNMTQLQARTCWLSSPNGTSFARSIWKRSKTFLRLQKSPTFAIFTNPKICASLALNMSASVVRYS